MNNVSIYPIDVSQEQLNNWAGVEVNSSKLDLFGSDKALISAAVVKCPRPTRISPIVTLLEISTAYCLGKQRTF